MSVGGPDSNPCRAKAVTKLALFQLHCQALHGLVLLLSRSVSVHCDVLHFLGPSVLEIILVTWMLKRRRRKKERKKERKTTCVDAGRARCALLSVFRALLGTSTGNFSLFHDSCPRDKFGLGFFVFVVVVVFYDPHYHDHPYPYHTLTCSCAYAHARAHTHTHTRARPLNSAYATSVRTKSNLIIFTATISIG